MLRKKIKQPLFICLLIISNSIYAQQPKLMLPVTHADGIRVSTISPDGKKLVTGSDDKTSKIWDIGTGKLLADLDAKNKMPISSIQFSSDGQKIITSSMDRNSMIWSAATGKLLVTLNRDAAGDNKKRIESPEGMEVGFSSVQFSPDNKRILTYDDIYPTARIWDAETGKFLFSLKEAHDELITVKYSPDRKKIITATQGSATIWDAATGILKRKLFFGKADQNLSDALFSPDSKQVITTMNNNGNAVKIWNVESGQLYKQLKNPGQGIFYTSLEFNPVDGQKIIATVSDSTIRILSAGNYEIIKSLQVKTGQLPDAHYTTDGKKIIVPCADGSVKLWDAITYQLLNTIPVLSTEAPGILFSADSKKIMTDSAGEKIMIWNTENGKRLADLSDISQSVLYKNFDADGGKAIAVLDDKTIRIWDANSGALLYDVRGHVNVDKIRKVAFNDAGKKLATAYTVYPFDADDSLMLTASGYYQCTPNAAKLLHYVTPDLKVISFEQLDVKYNRPDKILEAMGNPDTALISSYHNAYLKRINKLGIDTAAFNNNYSVPEADFANRNAIKLEQQTEMLELQIKANDNAYPLDRYNIWVNEVPLFGQRGISIKNENTRSLNKTINIQLSPGDNRIETSVTNVNGIESYRMPLSVKYITTKATPQKVYFIGIGINEFADNSHNLTWCVQDIKDLTTSMQSKYNNQFIILDTLYNQKVTRSNIQSLKQKLLNTSINDKVIIAFSGHGLLSKSYDYYLSSYNINFIQPEVDGIPYDVIESLLDSIPARQKILLLDACHSGEVDKEELQKINNAKNALVKNNVTATSGIKGLVGGGGDENSGKLGLQNSFELMQNLFVNVGKGTGAIIISASGGVQFAQERSELGHGVFTYSVIEAMKNNEHMKVADFKKYVGNRVLELTNGLQKPTTRNETIAADWNVW
ncbi:MAG: caspase family protein [Agriterribacter sp.]